MHRSNTEKSDFFGKLPPAVAGLFSAIHFHNMLSSFKWIRNVISIICLRDFITTNGSKSQKIKLHDYLLQRIIIENISTYI